MFDLDNTRQIFGETLAEYGVKNKKVVVLAADVSSSVMTTFFAKKAPERFFNVGIAEAGMIDTAVGFALGGFIPFTNTFAALFLRATEQIRTCVAYANTNVKIVGSFAGLSDAKDGATHHSIMDIAIMRAMPNMTVIVPSDSIEVKKMIPLIAEHEGPVYIRISRAEMPVIFDENHKMEIGKGVVMRDGNDVTIIANGHLLSRSLEAADQLNSRGIKARVVNLHTVKPVDKPLLMKCARETGAVVTAEEHSIIGGLGSAVAETLVGEIPVPIKMVGVADTFTESAKDLDPLLDKYGMSVEDIVRAAQQAVKQK
ncbi:MAG: transketolase family protein [Dehalococcoidia bacterium]|nr:MAG: transketolase family protein [Dehalococcoidia bacterium]